MNRISWAGFQGWDDSNVVGTSSVKQKNRGLILKWLLSERQLTRAELMRKTKLSAPTISRISSELVESGIVREAGIRQTGDVGAPGSVLTFNEGAGFVVGIDIGESVIQLALADLSGKIIDMEKCSTKAGLGGDRTLAQMLSGVTRLMKRNAITKDMLWCVCVGVPGTVGVYGDVIGVNAPDIHGWTQYPLKKKFMERLSVGDVFIENAQNLAVVCEHAVGCAQDCSNIVFIHVKAGIGAGVLLNGELYRGMGGMAGEIGFFMPSLDCKLPDLCSETARHGALEKSIGIHEVLRRLDERYGEIDSAEDLPNLESLYQRAADGDEHLYNVIRGTWDVLGMAAVNICALLNPQMIVLGGDVMPLGDGVRETVARYVETYCLQPCEVRLSTLGNQTCMVGAVQMACERAYQRLGINI